MITELCKELKRRTEVLDFTFEKCNLQIIQFTYNQCSGDNYDFDVFAEVAAVEGHKIENDVSIKVNLYDTDGELIRTSNNILLSDDFPGYDTVQIFCHDNRKALLEAKSARIYAVKF